MLALVGDAFAPKVTEWAITIRRAGRLRRQRLRVAAQLIASLPDEATLAGADLAPFRRHGAEFVRLREEMQRVVDGAQKSLSELRDAANKVISEKSATVGWRDVLDLFGDAAGLTGYLHQRHAREKLVKEHESAVKSFDQAQDAIVASKFSALSHEIKRWWDLLRPESTTAFESVAMRPKTIRTVDFKVALRKDEEAETGIVRDAVAVFERFAASMPRSRSVSVARGAHGEPRGRVG